MGWVRMDYFEEYENGWRYRRRVPKRLKQVISKREFKKKLGATEREGLAAYPAFHASVERQIKDADRKIALGQAADRGALTDKEAFRVAAERVSDMALEGVPWLVRQELADHFLEKYDRDPDTLDPVGVSDVDRHYVNIVRNGAEALPEPSPTTEDARKLYIEEKLGGEDSEENIKTVQRVNRVFSALREALGKDPALSSLKREDARTVRDHMLSQVKSNGEVKKPSSVKRELSIIKAALNHAIKEMDLVGKAVNHFNDLEIPTKGAPQNEGRERDPLPPKVLHGVRTGIIERANSDLSRIWRVLEGTGCRLAEVSGLRVEDVDADGELPHIRVEWHENRRVKTKASIRHIPLVGDALEAVKDALNDANNGPMLFPRYAHAGGPTAASKSLMKYVRKVSDNKKHVVHSLRHNMSDNLMLAGVDERTANLILGHALGGVGNRVYGGEVAKLRATTEAMKKAHEISQSGPVEGP